MYKLLYVKSYGNVWFKSMNLNLLFIALLYVVYKHYFKPICYLVLHIDHQHTIT